MKAKLLGVQSISFTNSVGESINGTSIYIAFADSAVQGLKTEKFFLKEEISLPKDTKLNDNLNITFNYKGKIETIELDK